MSDVDSSDDATTIDEINDRVRVLATALDNFMQQLPAVGHSAVSTLNPSQIKDLIEQLPHLSETDVIQLGLQDASCPICLNTFLVILAQEETAIAMDSPACPIEDLGVTRLSRCGHTFCRKDISMWINGAHGSCPMCRRPLLEPSDTNENVIERPTTPFFDQVARSIPQRIRDIVFRVMDDLEDPPSVPEEERGSDNLVGMYS